MAASIDVTNLQDARLFDCAVCCVVGATGSGKSAIAVKLCQLINGEIINADAIQLYRGLDIASARIPVSEQDGVPHHLLGSFSPDEPLTVRQYVLLAIQNIKDIVNRGKIPVITGGTNYYIEKVLFNDETDLPLVGPNQQDTKVGEPMSNIISNTNLQSKFNAIQQCLNTDNCASDSRGSISESATLTQIRGGNKKF
jgi:tRNA A37 N6-isopentenylltransferase MiaA